MSKGLFDGDWCIVVALNEDGTRDWSPRIDAFSNGEGFLPTDRYRKLIVDTREKENHIQPRFPDILQDFFPEIKYINHLTQNEHELGLTLQQPFLRGKWEDGHQCPQRGDGVPCVGRRVLRANHARG